MWESVPSSFVDSEKCVSDVTPAVRSVSPQRHHIPDGSSCEHLQSYHHSGSASSCFFSQPISCRLKQPRPHRRPQRGTAHHDPLHPGDLTSCGQDLCRTGTPAAAYLEQHYNHMLHLQRTGRFTARPNAAHVPAFAALSGYI